MSGKLVLRAVTKDGQAAPRVEILHADPRVLVSAKLVASWKAGFLASGVTLTDGVLRIEGSNRTVVYREGEYRHEQRVYVYEWPD